LTKAMIVLTFMTPALVAGTGRAAAQAQPNPGSAAFLNINVGAQPQQRTIATSESFPLYDETATVTSSQPVNNGPVFDIAGGYRVRRQLFVGVGFSTFQRSSASDLVASIPDLIFVDRPRPRARPIWPTPNGAFTFLFREPSTETSLSVLGPGRSRSGPRL
jgi:hypothetical protein